MKREWLAAALLLLLIAGAAANLRAADRLLDRVEYSLHRAEQAARREEYETALKALAEGRRRCGRETRPGPPPWRGCAIIWRRRTTWSISLRERSSEPDI